MRKLQMSFYTCKFHGCLKNWGIQLMTDSPPIVQISREQCAVCQKVMQDIFLHQWNNCNNIALLLTFRETWKCQWWIKEADSLNDKWCWRGASLWSFRDRDLIRTRQTLCRFKFIGIVFFCWRGWYLVRMFHIFRLPWPRPKNAQKH